MHYSDDLALAPELRHSEHHVNQGVLGYACARVSYYLVRESDDYIGTMVIGCGHAPSGRIDELAREFIERNRPRVLAMLRAAQVGNFRAARRGVIWRLREPGDWGQLRASAWFGVSGDSRPCMMSVHGMDPVVAREQAQREFEELPEETRRQLIDVALRSVH